MMVNRSIARFCFILQVVFIVISIFVIMGYYLLDDLILIWTVLLSFLITFITAPIYMDNYIMRRNLNRGSGKTLLYSQIGLYLFAAIMIPLIEYVDSSNILAFLLIFILVTVVGTVSTASIVFFFRQQNKKRASLIIGFIMSLVSLGIALLYWFVFFLIAFGLFS